ncbi:MAG TPA: hypothetical protein VFG04_19555 [Planctomycetaceae bacterium]|jgi:hypothetical protein|nr:hypothetical protein [Planctomycetaceae bacterium]
MKRSIIAVVAGIVVLILSSFAIEAIANPLMKMIGLFPDESPSTAVRLVTMAYTTVCIAAAGYVTAWIARRAPVLHALIMGAVQVGLTVALIIDQPDFAPPWAWIITVAVIMPAAWYGGAIRARQARGDLTVAAP